VWCNKILLSKPTTHKIAKGEYLTKISLKYYGTAKYWRELALINRAPDSDLVFPDEEIFIPSQEVIEQLYRARSLSRVNGLMDDEEQVFAQSSISSDEYLAEQTIDSAASSSVASLAEPEEEGAGAENESIAIAPPVKDSKVPPLFSIIGILGLLGLLAVVGFVIYKKRKQSEEKELLNELQNLDVDSDAESSDTESDEDEPDYQEYKKNRSERVYV